MSFAGVFFAFLFTTYCDASDDLHIRTSRLGPGRLITFRNIPGDVQYIPSFPLEQLMKESFFIANKGNYYPQHLSLYHVDSERDTLNVSLYYRVFTSVSDAEEKIVEVLSGDAAYYANAISTGKSGEIGDNCLYNDTSVWFIRNNVVVHIQSYPNFYPE